MPNRARRGGRHRHERIPAGRVGEAPALKLSERLAAIGFALGRLKTGTPPRLDGRTIDWARLENQPSDLDDWTMSALDDGVRVPQLACAIARTNSRTHDIIRDSFDRSPLFAGAIEGRGPRYCPSIEDKVKRFADRDNSVRYRPDTTTTVAAFWESTDKRFIVGFGAGNLGSKVASEVYVFDVRYRF